MTRSSDADPRWMRIVPHLVAISFGVGAVSATAVATPIGVGVLGALIGIVLVAVGVHRDVRLGVGGVALGVCLIGAAIGTLRMGQTAWHPLRTAQPLAVDAVVEETATRLGADRARIMVSLPREVLRNGRRVMRSGERILVHGTVTALGDIALGARVRIRGRVLPPTAPGDPEWWSDHLARRGVVAQMRSPNLRVIGRRGGAAGIRDHIRERLRQTAVAGLSGDRAAIVRGMALGGGQTMSPELIEKLRAAGVWHLMAVSGQNIALIAVAVVFLLGLVGLSRRRAAGISIVAIVGYCLVCDGGASVARAGVMGVLAVVALLASRATDRWYLLIVGLDILVGIRPTAIFDPGLQLSFVAVVGLLVLARPLAEWLAGFMPMALAAVTAQSVAASLATAPVAILRFSEYSVVGLAANVIAVPVAAPTVVLAMAGAVVGALVAPVGLPLTWCAGIGADIIRVTAETAAAVPRATVAPGAIGALLAVVLAVAIPLLAHHLWRRDGGPPTWDTRRRMRRGGILIVLLVIVGSGGAWAMTREHPLPWPTRPEMMVVDVGQGDAILLRSPDGHAALMDTGPPGEPAPIVRALRRHGVHRLDLVALTHDQADHDGALPEILDAVDVGQVATAAPAAPGVTERGGIAAKPLHQGQELTVGAWRLEVLWPPPDLDVDDPNDASLVVLARAPGVSALLTGDAEGDVIRRLTMTDVDVLKVSHHGSDDENLPRVLQDLRPAAAVISVGAQNSYGHPTPETLAALAAARVRTWRTDRDGSVRVSRDASGLTVRDDP